MAQKSARDCPPSTFRQAPRTRLAASEARKATTRPTSSGRPKRPERQVGLEKCVDPVRILPGPPFPAAAGEHDGARRDGVHADAERRELHGEGLRHPDLGGLGGDVRRALQVASAPLAAVDRHDVDDGAAAPRAHARHHEPARADGRHQVQVDRPLPLLRAGLLERAAGRPANVVDQDVHATERGLRRAHRSLYAFRRGHVGGDGDRLHPERPHGAGGGLERLAPPRTESHATSLARELYGNAAPDPTAAPCHERCLALEPEIHACPSCAKSRARVAVSTDGRNRGTPGAGEPTTLLPRGPQSPFSELSSRPASLGCWRIGARFPFRQAPCPAGGDPCRGRPSRDRGARGAGQWTG